MRRRSSAPLLLLLLILALSSQAETGQLPVDTAQIQADARPRRPEAATPPAPEEAAAETAPAGPDTGQTGAGPRQAPADTGLVAARALLQEAQQRDRRGGIEYRAAVYVYSQSGDSLLLRGDPAVVTHRGAQLEAAELVYHRARGVVEARARIDSNGAVSGEPLLKRGDEILRGTRILYDLESEQGTILTGRIQREKGYYAGDRIRTLSEAEFYVQNGSYTTCDYPEPHFDFYSPRIKVIADEMAIARPVYLRVARKRIFWIPFYIFSLRQDRQSGILTPTFGRRPIRFGSRQTEWELRNLGYYFAPSDYWDLTLAGDLRQRSGWLARLDLAYARRYHWNGKIDLQLENRQEGDRLQRAWRVDLNHSQELSPTSQVRASGTFQSNKSFNRDNSTDLQDRLNRTLRSNLSYSKRWQQSGNSLSLAASQTRNLDTETFDLVLPEVSFRKARKPLWGGQASATGDPQEENWYSRLYYDGSARLRNSQRGTPADTTKRTSADLSLRVSSQHKPFSWLQFSPSLEETWQDEDLRRAAERGRRTEQVNATTSLTQTFYGLFHPPLWRVNALRHVLKPNLSFGYQASRADTGGVFGVGGESSPWKQRRQVTLRLDNSFWAKVQSGEEETKVRLAQLNLSTGYDFENDDRPLADLSTTLSVEAGRLLDTRLTMRSEFYDQTDDLRLAVPRLKQLELRTNLRYTVRGQTTERKAGEGDPLPSSPFGPETTMGDPSFSAAPYDQQRFGYESGLRSDIQQRGRGTSFQVSHYFSRTRSTSSILTRSWLRLSLGFSLGHTQYRTYDRPRWHFNYSLNYDLHAPDRPLFSADRLTSELLSVQRDFHDWTATFNLEPFGFRRDRTFFFKAQLRDIPQLKFERGDSRL